MSMANAVKKKGIKQGQHDEKKGRDRHTSVGKQ